MINFPNTLDTDETLFVVHDGLRLQLAEDYLPGDTTISVFGDDEVFRRFPDVGILTLTEQCSDGEERAISFTYTSKNVGVFEGLTLIEGFLDSAKPKIITNVIQNVMAEHHNLLKTAIIEIEKYLGKKGETSNKPLAGTFESRLNYLRNIALAPKAWFDCDKNVGLIPLKINFRDLSFRLGTKNVQHIWDFGDNTGPSIITIDETDNVETSDVIVNDTDGGTISKIYSAPGTYDVKLTVKNDYGEDTIVLPGLINARIPAPDEAVLIFNQKIGQIVNDGTPLDGPYVNIPTIRATTNTIVEIEIQSGTNPNTLLSYGGEQLNAFGSPIDPITQYTWSLADDISHNSSSLTRASYSIGGVYDAILRVDTKFGSYRITTYENAIDIIEKYNLWLWTIDNGSANSYEFGLLSETFKTKSNSALSVNYDDSFLDGANNEIQQKREFIRNNGFIQRGTTTSGSGGVGLLYWASGRSEVQTASDEEIKFYEFNGFNDTYASHDSISRPWNWVSFGSLSKLYFVLGGVTTADVANQSPTNQNKTILNLNDLAVSTTALTISNYKNGADELTQNEVDYDSGVSEQGNMSVYRSCWLEDTGYLLRNEGAGNFFRMKSFYKTSGNSTESFIDIKKLPDMSGSVKTEGQLVPMKAGVFFFNNSGSISAYNPLSNVWETGGPGINSSSFRLLQDTNISDFDDTANTLVACSDSDQIAYLSFDYSNNAFVKFNATDLTFIKLGSRPSGEQWLMDIF